jgi:MscS family membrane protein
MTVEELMQQAYFGNTLMDYLKALLIILSSIVAGKVVYYFINRYLKKLAEKTETQLDDLIIDAIEEPLIVAIVAGGVYLAFQTLVMPDAAVPLVAGLITAAFIIDAVWLAVRIVDILIKEVLMPITQKTDSNLDDQLMPIISKGFKAIIAILGLLIILSKFGIDITALVAGLGIGGLAFALASKDTVENMFGAFAILLDKPFMVKDRIIIEGVTGDVMEVGLRSTRLKTLDNTELYLPNAKIVTGKVENISRPDRGLVMTVKLNVTYETSTAKLKEALGIVKAILADVDGISRGQEPTVVFNEFEDSSLQILVKYWISDYSKKYIIANDINLRIKEGFEKAGVEFAYPTQKIYLAK